MKINTYFWSYLAQFLLECEMFYTELYRTLKPTSYAQSLFFFFFFENPTLYEIMWKNTTEPNKLLMIIWWVRIACWVTKATSTHSDYEFLIAFPLQNLLQESASILRYSYIACPVIIQMRCVSGSAYSNL